MSDPPTDALCPPGAAYKTMSCQEQELDPSCSCAVCHLVLLDPVSLPCGHTLDRRCLQRVVDAADGGTGRRVCPSCMDALPENLPRVNLAMRDLMHRLHPEQVRRNPRRWGRGLPC